MSSPKVLILVSGASPYSTGSRSFIQLGAGLLTVGADCYFAPNNCGAETVRTLITTFGAARVLNPYPESERPRESLIREVTALGPEVLLTDDYLPKLRLASRIAARSGASLVTYVLSPYGLHGLRPYPVNPLIASHQRLLFDSARLVPFSTLTSHYRRLLQKSDAVISISHYMEMLLQLAYGVRSVGIVYPPVNVGVFRRESSKKASPPNILCFIGGPHDRAPSEYTRVIHDLAAQGVTVSVFGEERSVNALVHQIRNPLVVGHSRVSDAQLHNLYAMAHASYLVPEWEGFGLVGPESLLSGTPVVCESSFPWMEVSGLSPLFTIARARNRLLDALLNPPNAPEDEWEALTHRLKSKLDPLNAAREFLELLPGHRYP